MPRNTSSTLDAVGTENDGDHFISLIPWDAFIRTHAHLFRSDKAHLCHSDRNSDVYLAHQSSLLVAAEVDLIVNGFMV